MLHLLFYQAVIYLSSSNWRDQDITPIKMLMNWNTRNEILTWESVEQYRQQAFLVYRKKVTLWWTFPEDIISATMLIYEEHFSVNFLLPITPSYISWGKIAINNFHDRIPVESVSNYKTNIKCFYTIWNNWMKYLEIIQPMITVIKFSSIEVSRNDILHHSLKKICKEEGF